MFYGHPISDFAYGKGVRVPVYQINNVYEEGQTTNYYALINGTYYQVSNLNNYAIYQGENQNFLTSMNKDGGLRYGYEVKIEDTPESEDGLLTEKYGISTSTETYRVTDFYTETEPSGFDYNNVDDAPNFELCFSQKFNYRDVGTWSFRDYFLFYIYINFLSKSGFSIDTFKSTSVYGIVGQAANGKYYLRVQQALIGNETLFLDMEGVMNISEQNMMDEIDVDETYSQNRFEYLNDLIFVQVYDESTLFSTSEVETKEFRFSEGVRLENIRQWTMEDFILFWLDSIGVINIDKNLDEYVYTSIVFKGISGGNIAANTTKLYSFGMGENKLYLNESYLLKNYNNIDQWLNASLIGYLSKTFSSDSSGNVHSLLLEESAAISSVLNNENINEYVFAFNSLLTF